MWEMGNYKMTCRKVEKRVALNLTYEMLHDWINLPVLSRPVCRSISICCEAMVGQLNDILESMSVLRTLDVSDVEPTAHVAPIPTPLRPDVVRESLSSSEALQEAPKKADTSFVVPKIVG